MSWKHISIVYRSYILNVSEKLPVSHIHLNIGQSLVHSERSKAGTSTLNFMA